MKVFVARRIPDAGIAVMKKAGMKVEMNKDADKVLSKKQLISKTKDKDALLCLLTDKVDDALFEACPKLKIVANYAVGFDNIDVESATKRGILVTNTPGVLTETVAEHTLALMISAARRIVEADKFTRQGRYKAWGPLLMLGQDLKGKTLGVVGMGRIGSAVCERAVKGMGMNVIYTDIYRNKFAEKQFKAKRVPLSRLLKQADFITLHVTLTPKTKHLIGRKELGLMKKNAVLVNTSRGPVVDESALVDSLKKNNIFAAALDVFECEPSITCNPKAKVQLKHLDNVILTPHIASASIETRDRMAVMAAQSIVDFAKGKRPQNVVNKEVL